MDNNFRDVVKAISQSKSVAITAAKVDNYDLAASIIALYLFVQSQGKKAAIILAEDLGSREKKLFEEYAVPFEKNVEPLNYVVTIDYGQTGIDKVTYDTDEQNGKIMFYITPTSGTFDFNNIDYSQSGVSYDLTITVGITNFKQMGEVYDKADYLFKNNKVISFAKKVESLGDTLIQVSEKGAYSEQVYEVVKADSSNVKPEILNLLLKGMVDHYNVLESSVSQDAWRSIYSVIKFGGDMKSALDSIYFSKSYPNLDLDIELMHKARVDKSARVIWSVVSQADLQYAGVTSETLNTKGRIIFNTAVKEFDLALAAYEIERDVLQVFVESNSPLKYSASKIATVFGGQGDDWHAKFIIKDASPQQFENKVFRALDEIYGLKIKGETVEENYSKNDANKSETLTKESGYSKNSDSQ